MVLLLLLLTDSVDIPFIITAADATHRLFILPLEPSTHTLPQHIARDVALPAQPPDKIGGAVAIPAYV